MVALLALAFLSALGVKTARARGGLKAALALSGLLLTLVGLSGIASPFVGALALRTVTSLLATALVAAVVWGPKRIATGLAELPQRRLARAALLASLGAIVPFGTAELVARFLTDRGLIGSYQPMRVVGPAAAVDPRLEPDAVLFWRPAPRYPYNRQRFKGPEAAVPKPPGVFRIIAYGDSNTAGSHGSAAWPALLEQELTRGAPPGTRNELRIEVLNAGVHGYSSYQGLGRFRREAAEFAPDLVLVSFGWNDPARVGRPPDSRYARFTDGTTQVLETLFRYRLFLVLLALREETEPAGDVYGPRVTLSEYRENLAAFAREARAHGSRVVLLTRPHRQSADTLRSDPDALREALIDARDVPRYNDAVLAVAAAVGIPVIDVRAWFEAEHADLFVDTCHFSDEGQRLAAVFLAGELRQRGLVP